jgi:hypothetical protein
MVTSGIVDNRKEEHAKKKGGFAMRTSFFRRNIVVFGGVIFSINILFFLFFVGP